MEEIKAIENTPNDKYLRIVPIIAKYIKNKNISPIFRCKYPLFAAAGIKGRIYIFSNSLEHMGTFYGHKNRIDCLCAISNKILASGSNDNTIKIWDIENRAIMSTLSEHRWGVTALCYMSEGVFVSGSKDTSLIIWSKYENPGSSSTSTYSHRKVLLGHHSIIRGIIRFSNTEIISGESDGNLRIWDIVQGVCIRYIRRPMDTSGLCQMKRYMGVVVVNYRKKVNIWGAANNWEYPLKQFSVCPGYPIEFLSIDILLRGGYNGDLEFIDYRGILPLTIHDLHSRYISDIQRIAKNIVITVSDDGSIKVIDPILRKCYGKLKKGDERWMKEELVNVIDYFY